MLLKSFTYRDAGWSVEGLRFGLLNLVVGRNATGKSRVLNSIDLFAKILLQRRDLSWGGTWEAELLAPSGEVLRISLKTAVSGATSPRTELVEVDGQEKLVRNRDGSIRLYNEHRRAWDNIFPPPGKLGVHVARDVRRYPYLEQIAIWAESSYGFKFGNISPNSQLNIQEYDLLTSVDQIPGLFKELSTEGKKQVMLAMQGIGFNVERILHSERFSGPVLIVSEHGIEKPLPHYKLSQGMFRTLSLLIYLEYLSSKRRPYSLVIDDLGEGLDYLRAMRLGKHVFDFCGNNGIQLIATSNDHFLLDQVDITHWNVLERKGKEVQAINPHNHPDLFAGFPFTGLSNYEFFSSDYIRKELGK